MVNKGKKMVSKGKLIDFYGMDVFFFILNKIKCKMPCYISGILL